MRNLDLLHNPTAHHARAPPIGAAHETLMEVSNEAP